jgi:putative endonuclease
MKNYCVYILSNSAGTLYIGITSNLDQRIFEHKDGHDAKSFSCRYNLNRLVLVETFPTALQAIAREKQLKGWIRAKKLKLIREQNPEFRDLSAEYGVPNRENAPEADPSTSLRMTD